MDDKTLARHSAAHAGAFLGSMAMVVVMCVAVAMDVVFAGGVAHRGCEKRPPVSVKLQDGTLLSADGFSMDRDCVLVWTGGKSRGATRTSIPRNKVVFVKVQTATDTTSTTSPHP